MNPVALSLYNQVTVEAALGEKGFEVVTCVQNHMSTVKAKYQQLLEESDLCIIDMRCPSAVVKVRKKQQAELFFPSIQPILIHCAKELSERYQGENVVLYITTPCTALKELGNHLKLENTVFQTWNEFASENQIHLPRKPLEESPIPPGFFQDCGYEVQSLASKQEIDWYFSGNQQKPVRLVEMLYCEQGCHNGDGILEDKP